MSVMLIIQPIIHMLWFVIPFAILGLLFKSRWFKGALGEFSVNHLIQKELGTEKYHLLKNVTIPCEGGTTQIDHIIASEYGFFVLETKNMQGWIFGGERQKMWTQKMNKSHSAQFQNPLHQNYKHVKALQQLLDLNDEQIHSLIVFIGSSSFKTDMPVNVTQGKGCLKFIQSKKEVVFSQQEVRKIVAKIEQERLEPSLKTHIEHVQHVKTIVNEKQVKTAAAITKALDHHVNVESPKQDISSQEQFRANLLPAEGLEKQCPICGNSMLLKASKSGQYKGKKFWGCSQFPKCTTMVSVETDALILR